MARRNRREPIEISANGNPQETYKRWQILEILGISYATLKRRISAAYIHSLRFREQWCDRRQFLTDYQFWCVLRINQLFKAGWGKKKVIERLSYEGLNYADYQSWRATAKT